MASLSPGVEKDMKARRSWETKRLRVEQEWRQPVDGETACHWHVQGLNFILHASLPATPKFIIVNSTAPKGTALALSFLIMPPAWVPGLIRFKGGRACMAYARWGILWFPCCLAKRRIKYTATLRHGQTIGFKLSLDFMDFYFLIY